MVCNVPSYDLTKHNPRQMSTGLPPSGEYLGGVDDQGDQQVYPYKFLHTKMDQWTSCLHLCLFSTYICTWRSKVGHISPCSSVFFFVVLNSTTIFIPSTVIFGC